ncbi:MAG TPA: sigma-70 family RNA polymerase sigma factor [Methylomirabilota bacterium]|nr:sigma-70 family RNA polymerase sigma factor [Methylomirabilota bacterium]
MDLATLIGRAQQQDLDAFAEITRRFQHMAFGYALSILRDLGKAEDVVQESFVAAWFGLARLEDPAAFPGWLRGIVRHQAHRVLRRKHLEAALPLAEAHGLAAEAPEPEGRIERGRRANTILAAITELPDPLREVVILFYVHECSQQDIATFLGLPVTTVNNRLHAARAKLKRKVIAMVKDTLASHALPDDFAARIGRIVRAREGVIEARFDPEALPGVLTELTVSDEARQRAIIAQVVQRRPDGLVRAVSTGPADALSPGMAVLSERRPPRTPLRREDFARTVAILSGPPEPKSSGARLLETGVKVIDVMCPLNAGGTLAVAGEYQAGTVVLVEELVRRLCSGADRLSIFSMIPVPMTMSVEELWKKEGFSEGTVGAVETFYFPGEEGAWTTDRLASLAGVDAMIRLSEAVAKIGIYPPVDPLASRSRVLETAAVSPAHMDLARRARQALALATAPEGAPEHELARQRARKLLRFFAQPFFVAEPYTKRPGSHVPLAEALRGCRAILDGECDDLPAQAFYFTGTLDDVRRAAAAPAARQGAGGAASSGGSASP